MSFLHTEIIDELQKKLAERAKYHRDQMAKGLTRKAYWQAVGSHREVQRIEEILQEIADKKDIDTDDDDQAAGR